MFNKASDTLSDYYYFQADIKGNSSVPDMSGTARFYPWLDGTMVEIELTGMPTRNEPFAVHIHEGAVCEPEAFTSAGMHLKNTDVELEVSPERHETNIKNTQNHPGHMGDLPSIFSNNGYAYMATYTDRFIPRQVEGRTRDSSQFPRHFHFKRYIRQPHRLRRYTPNGNQQITLIFSDRSLLSQCV